MYDVDSANARLDEIGSLTSGWLDGTGDEITASAVANSRLLAGFMNPAVLAQTGIYPTVDGGVQFELEVNAENVFEIQVDPSGSFKLSRFDLTSEKDDAVVEFDSPEEVVVSLHEYLMEIPNGK